MRSQVMLMTQTEINNLLKQINGAFESLEVRVKALEAKLEDLSKPKSGNSTKTKEKA
jgi:chaperonin cofactor prefoldin